MPGSICFSDQLYSGGGSAKPLDLYCGSGRASGAGSISSGEVSRGGVSGREVQDDRRGEVGASDGVLGIPGDVGVSRCPPEDRRRCMRPLDELPEEEVRARSEGGVGVGTDFGAKWMGVV